MGMRITKEEQYRRDGMLLAYKIVKKAMKEKRNPQKELYLELCRLNSDFKLTPLSRSELNKMQKEANKNGTKMALAVSEMVLLDDFEFSKDRLEKYKNTFNELMGYIKAGYTTVDNIEKVILEETGVDLTKEDERREET